METKTIQLEIPEYLTIGQYQGILNLPEGDNKIEQNLYLISTLTNLDIEELKYWDLSSVKKVAGMLEGLMDPKNEFHSIVEWNGVMYGYDNIRQQTLGEYIDLETLSKDVKNNLHKIAAILYRPITEHRFNSLKFIAKNTIKVLKHKDVANVFDYYDIEKYDSKVRKKRELEFKEFPVHVILGALSFFLTNASQYLNNTVYSEKVSKKKIEKMNNLLLESLSATTGAGGGLSIRSVRPIYYQYQGKSQLQTLT